MPQAKAVAALLLLATALLLAGAASAQENEAPAQPARAERRDLAQACDAREGLSLCVQTSAPKRGKAKAESREDTSRFTRLTRLAGMFMGRVDAAEIGNFRFRFQLELR